MRRATRILARARKPPSAAPAVVADPWQAVQDPQSGGTYWWNKQTNETTHVGAPKPVANQASPPPAQQQTGALGQPMGGGGFMGAIAEWMAWGVGSAVGHRAIDAMMGPRQVEHVHTNQDGGAPADSGGYAGGGAGTPMDGNQGFGEQQSEFGW